MLSVLLTAGCTYRIGATRYYDASLPHVVKDLKDAQIRSAAPPAELPAPDVIVVHPVRIEPELLGLPNIEDYRTSLSARLYRRVLIQPEKRAVIKTADEDLRNYLALRRRIYDMDTTLTHIGAGRGWLRYFVGYGAGDAYLQLEGRIVNRDDGRTVGSFAVGDRTNGNPWLGWNVKVFSDRYCLGKAIERATLKVAWYLRPLL